MYATGIAHLQGNCIHHAKETVCISITSRKLYIHHVISTDNPKSNSKIRPCNLILVADNGSPSIHCNKAYLLQSVFLRDMAIFVKILYTVVYNGHTYVHTVK